MCNIDYGFNVICDRARIPGRTVRTVQVELLMALDELKRAAKQRRVDVRDRIDLYTHTPGIHTPEDNARWMRADEFRRAAAECQSKMLSSNGLPLLANAMLCPGPTP